MNMKVSFLGLGVMGYPMAGHLASHSISHNTGNGYQVCVYNRTAAKAQKWVEQHGNTAAVTSASTPAAAAEGADFVFACVGNDDDLRSVTIGADGAFQTMKSDAVFIDHTTASANIARQLYDKAKNDGLHFLDAPVSGGQAGAENGVLTVMAGGDPAIFQRSKPLLDCYAKSAKLVGSSGAGQLTKMVNQICIAGLVQGLSEGVAFAINAGLDPALVFDVISKGAAQSWQMENRAQSMVADHFEHGFAVDWMRKDLGLCFEQAKLNGSELPITEIVDGYYSEVQAAGGNRYDTSSLLTRLYRKDLNGSTAK